MSDLVVRPVRFTDDVEPARRFYTALGLAPRLESVRGGWVDLVGASGMLALHSAADSARGAPSGLTSLSFEADDIEAVADRLRAGGVLDVVVYDEAYGRVLTFRDPLGAPIAVDEAQDDLYGYRPVEPATPADGLTVVAVCFTALDGPYAAFLRTLGLELRGNAAYVAAYEPGAGHGQVLLHPPAPGMPPLAEESGAVRLSFESTEPASRIADRLAAAGFASTFPPAEEVAILRAIDPDGLEVEVYAAPEG